MTKKTEGIRITEMMCGYYHTVVLSDTGSCYSWGYNYYGQLGLGFEGGQRVETPQHIKHIPTKVLLIVVRMMIFQ
jgi:alpha-tubulin suppressor-like RCC1 family protein